MSSKNNLSAKILIIDYCDELVRQIDIYTEQTLERINDNDVIVPKEREKQAVDPRNFCHSEEDSFADPFNDKYEYTDSRVLPISGTKVKDYVNNVRLRAMEEVDKFQAQSLEYYKANKSRINEAVELNEADLFANRFVFTLNFENMEDIDDSMPFKMALIISDFFINHSDLDLLKYFLSYKINQFNIELRKINYNSKTLLLRLLANYLNGLLKDESILGNEIIRIDKKTLLSINKLKLDREIISCFNINDNDDLKVDFVNLKSLGLSSSNRLESSKLNLENLTNLQHLFLRNVTLNSVMFKNMIKLRHLSLNNCYIQMNDSSGEILKQLSSSLETLNVNGLHRPVFTYQYETTRFFYLKPIHVAEDFRTAIKLTNLARGIKTLENLKCLRLVNFELEQPDDLNFLASLSSDLRTLDLDLYYSDLNDLDRLFNGVSMPNLRELGFHSRYYGYLNTSIGVRIEWFVAGFANLRKLDISRNDLESVDLDEFDFPHLESLDLSFNRIRTIKSKSTCLRSLVKLDLSNNLIASIEPNAFENLTSLRVLDLRENSFDYNRVDSNIGNENFFKFSFAKVNIKIYS